MASVLLIKAERLSEQVRWITAPNGILSLAASARAAGHRVDVLDLRVVAAADAAATVDGLLARRPDVVGLSSLSSHLPQLAALARHIRRKLPGATILAGGPGPSSDTEECFAGAPLDAIVVGEGELTLNEILGRIDAGREWRDVAGIAVRGADGAIVRTPPRPLIEDVDSLPDPAWDLHDFTRYERFLSMSSRRGRRAEVVTSRGCPYRCAFCHTLLGKRFRARSPARVLAEWEMLHRRYGIRRFEVIDDIFNADPERAKEILRMFRARLRGCELTFPNGIRGDILDEEMMRLLAAAPTAYLGLAVETASPRLQAMLRKNLDLDRLARNVRRLKELGVHTSAFFLIGLPTETDAERDATFEFARGLPIDFPHFCVLVPYRRTGVWEMLGGDFHERVTVDALKPLMGWSGASVTDVPTEQLQRRCDDFMTRYLFLPQNWYIVWHELAWGGGRTIAAKITRTLAPEGKYRQDGWYRNQYMNDTPLLDDAAG